MCAYSNQQKGMKNVTISILNSNKSNQYTAEVGGRYSMEQGNPSNFFEITNKIVFVLSPDLLFYLMYLKGYQR